MKETFNTKVQQINSDEDKEHNAIFNFLKDFFFILTVGYILRLI